jgi:lipopolysaccharide transport system permease protein
MLSLYVYVFSFIFGGTFGVLPNETRLEYGLGVFIGLTFFHLVAEMLGAAPTFIVVNPNFVKKVVFPLEVLPAAGVGAAAIHMLISLGLVLIGVVFFGPGLHAGLLWLPVIILPLLMFCLGGSWFLSALGVFLRDTGQFIQFTATVLMWCSAVFYSPYRFKSAWLILRFNPLLIAIEQGREAVLWQRPLNPNHLAYLYLSSLLVFVLGYAIFARLKPAFADVV